MPHTATAMRTPSRCAHRPPGTSSKRWPVWGGWTDSVDSPMGGPARPCVIEAAPGFCAGTGFDGIAPGIFMSAALHGAKVMVDEKGTEAAAATAMEFPSSEPPQADLTIVADRRGHHPQPAPHRAGPPRQPQRTPQTAPAAQLAMGKHLHHRPGTHPRPAPAHLSLPHIVIASCIVWDSPA